MTGIILFRAQPFHNGHLAQVSRAIIDRNKGNISRLYIIVGSADKVGTKRNPIPIDVRIDLISNSLKEYFGEYVEKFIKIIPLNDLSDEANNTHSWGTYLYKNLCEITNDTEFLIYYSDRPEIMLSWFSEDIQCHIAYKFLPRHEDISATLVRECLINNDIRVIDMVPNYVYKNKENIIKYLV